MTTDVVYVPVPTQWLSEIYKRLAELSSTPATEADAAALAGSVAVLDRSLVRRMYDESEKPHRRLMLLMAEHPDEWRYSSEIAADLELEHGARGLAGMLGAFGRRAKHRYGAQKPWRSEWDSGREEARHLMPADVAQTIRELAQAT